MNSIRTIATDKIKPFPGQPRKYFDEQALLELATSIKQQGQYTPAWVVALDDKPGFYQLVAGERRWRACQLVGIPTLICEVREYDTKAEIYIASVMENFGRKDCTTMETARSVGQLLKACKNSYTEVASIFARSTAWVQQLNCLNKLLPEVQSMLDPPNAALTTQVGVTLSNLQPDIQLQLAREIASRGLKHRGALALVRSSVTNDQRVSKRGKRRPADDFAILRTFLNVIGPQAQAIMALGDDRLKAMFTHRAVEDKRMISAVIKKRIEQLKELDVLLR